jgi:branched-chain amino acid transport system ATP-binding protein
MSEMLVVRDLRVSYGQIEVIKGISLSVSVGSIVTLIGANGAGKTTTINTISGLLQPREGSIEFFGERIDKWPPEVIVKKGIVQVPEGRKVFRNLTVLENLLMGGLSRPDRGKMRQDLEEAFEIFPLLRERQKQLAGTLSGGEQQMLAFGRAMMAKPRLLLLDEPSMGLAPLLVEQVADAILDFKKRGITILLVEQNAELGLSLADKGYVLETGTIVLEDQAGRLLEDDMVKESYLGL